MGSGFRHLRGAYGFCNVAAAEQETGPRRAFLEVHLGACGQLPEGRGIAEVGAGLQRQQRHRPVHGSRINGGVAEPGCQ